MKRRKAYAREERLQQIIGVFLESYRHGFTDMTTAEIARRLDVTPSTKFRNLLKSLLVQEVLSVENEEHVGISGFRAVWSLSESYKAYAQAPASQQKKGRELRINTRKGSFVEVLR